MLNIKTVLIWSSGVCQWRLREERGHPKKTWWNCVKEAMMSLACPMSMLRTKVIGG